MEKNFTIRATHHVNIRGERFSFRQSFVFDNFEAFCEYLAMFRHDPRYMYEYIITSTSTPSCPFVRWSKKTRLPIGYKGSFLGLIYNTSDRKYTRLKKLF